jgi:glyoxylase-like metal-dependent hydrolase (beta-lactamase superfamily II)/rhodanese-related sulfurtransferase
MSSQPVFKQYYLGCLAHASYLIGDGGQAVVVDPQRDVDEYIRDAAALGLEIRHVIETHLHADFVSGHRELARRTGATIHLGHRAGAEFEHAPIHEGDELTVGRVRLRFLETPGHTPESVCILVAGAGGQGKLISGDTLFIGDVGRPDLVASRGHTAADMASAMYDSLAKLRALPDDVEVYPAHGAGSACGRFLSDERSSTIGAQRRVNWALAPQTRDEFIARMTTDLPPPPAYFPHDAEINRRGAPGLDELPPLAALSPDDVERALERGALVLDVRSPDAFADGHVAGATSIGLRGSFAPWAGTLLPLDRPIVLVADGLDAANEANVRLARVGLDHVAGFLDGGVDAWQASGRPLRRVPRVTADGLRERLARSEPIDIVDVRTPTEHAGGAVPGARNVPLARLRHVDPEVRADRPTYVICAAGYRSAIAWSLLASAGFDHVIEVIGGHAAWNRLDAA